MSVTSLDIIAQYSGPIPALLTQETRLFSKLGRWTLIAETMSVSIATVKSHRESAMRKLRGEHFSRTFNPRHPARACQSQSNSGRKK